MGAGNCYALPKPVDVVQTDIFVVHVRQIYSNCQAYSLQTLTRCVHQQQGH